MRSVPRKTHRETDLLRDSIVRIVRLDQSAHGRHCRLTKSVPGSLVGVSVIEMSAPETYAVSKYQLRPCARATHQTPPLPSSGATPRQAHSWRC